MTKHRVLEVEYNDADEGKEVVLHFRPYALRKSPRIGAGHLRSANREVLLAVRSLLDEAIEWMAPAKSEGPKRQRVKVTEPKKGGA